MEVGSVGTSGGLNALNQSEAQSKNIIELGQEMKKVEASEEAAKNLEAEKTDEESQKETETNAPSLVKDDENSGKLIDLLG